MLDFVGNYAGWCYSRSDIRWLADIHDNLLFRFVFAPIGETVLFVGPLLIALLLVGNLLPDPHRAN